jgi:hypothetical protein
MSITKTKKMKKNISMVIKTTLVQEIDSWNNFEYALRKENRLLFNKMLSECKENEDLVRAANSKDEYFSAESLLMGLILQQQKMINELNAKVSEKTMIKC